MLAIILKKITDNPTYTAVTALAVGGVIILTLVHLSYEIRIKKLQLENLEK